MDWITLTHELGHLAHASYSPGTYFLTASGHTTQAIMEHDAIFEYLGDVTKVIYAQYNGPSSSPALNPSVSWSSWNDNYSIQMNHSDMSGSNAYYNARVGGHAFYELVQIVGLQTAAKTFFMSFPQLSDFNGNGALTWHETRKAMENYANSTSNSTLISAVQNAWYDVGVGPSSTGSINPPTDYDNGAPQAPQNISVSLVNMCDNNAHTVHDIYHWSQGPGFNKTYHLWFSQNGTTVLKASSNSSPTYNVWNAAPVTVRVSVCDLFLGCSAMSPDSEELQYFCQ